MITLALPTYNNSDIIWLQLESFCRQENAPEWELIICEEQSEKYFGLQGIEQYKERLFAANCQQIKYIAISEWVTLGQKWMIIRDEMHPDSIGYLLCASDNFSPKDRIAKSYEAFKNGADWVQQETGYFYNILAHEAGLYQQVRQHASLFMGASSEAIKGVFKEKFPKKSVDTWLFRAIDPKKYTALQLTDGVHTDGFNTISLHRRDVYGNSTLFSSADADFVLNLFPKDIQKRLKKMSHEHKKT
jgi:hypothetical protein